MHRFLSALVYALVLGAPFALAQSTDRTYLRTTQPLTISAVPVPFLPATAASRTTGRMTFICGLALTADVPQFGGLSGLAMSRDGQVMTAVTDEGAWLKAEAVYRGDCITGLKKASIGPLLGENGRPLAQKRTSDSEGLAVERTGETSGTVYVSFERKHRLAQYRLKDGVITGKAKTIALPSSARRLGNNEGPEAVAVIQGGPQKGGVLVIAEAGFKGSAEDTPAPAWLLKGGKTEAMQVILKGGFKITDAVSLENGDVLVLERRFKGIWEGVQMRIRHIDAADVKGGARLDGTVLMEASSFGYDVDNMEGIAVHPAADGEIIVTVVSDNNFSALQRTLLLQFRYRP